MLENFNQHWGSGADGTVFDEHKTEGFRRRPKGIPFLTLCATFVDPRTKSMQGLNNDDKNQVRAAIKTLLREEAQAAVAAGNVVPAGVQQLAQQGRRGGGI